MYENYKNQVVSNFATLDINFNEDQINKILSSMDKAFPKMVRSLIAQSRWE